MNPLTWRGAALRATERSAKLPILKRERATFSAQEAEPVSFSFMLIAEMATSQAELLSTKRTTGELLLCEKSDTRSAILNHVCHNCSNESYISRVRGIGCLCKICMISE